MNVLHNFRNSIRSLEDIQNQLLSPELFSDYGLNNVHDKCIG